MHNRIARIELITNPSAQFTTRGTGGIINIVTRRSVGAGVGGSLTALAGNYGSYDFKASPSWSGGRLALSGSLGVNRTLSRSEFEEAREGTGPGEDEVDRLEQGRSRNRANGRTASLVGTIELAPKQSFSLNASAIDFDSKSSRVSEIRLAGGSEPFEQRSSGEFEGSIKRVSADFRREGGRAGELTTFSVTHSAGRGQASNRFLTQSADDGLSAFRLRSDQSTDDSVVKFDHVRPAGDRRLSIGGLFQHSDEQNRTRSMMDEAAGGSGDGDVLIKGSWSEAAAYATYQFPFAGNLVLAGARLESRRFELADVADDPAGGTHLFPSLHVERKLKTWLTANLSYSSRIGWPGLTEYDPRLRFSDPVTARAGNPDLKPERTNSFELKLMARAGKHGADLTAFLQRTRDLRSSLVELEDEVLVTRPVNLGRRKSWGASLSLRGPLARGLSYTATADLARDRIAGNDLFAGVDDGGARYGASLQVEYRDGIEGRAGADQLALRARYAGPIETGLERISSVWSAGATWSHAFTGRLSSVLTASWASRVRISSSGEGVVSQRTDRATAPRIMLALTYGLGTPGK